MTESSLREKINEEIGEFYFIHCKKEIRPEFKTLEEAQSWSDVHIFQIEQIVGKTTDTILSLLLTELQGVIPKEKPDLDLKPGFNVIAEYRLGELRGRNQALSDCLAAIEKVLGKEKYKIVKPKEAV